MDQSCVDYSIQSEVISFQLGHPTLAKISKGTLIPTLTDNDRLQLLDVAWVLVIEKEVS